MIIMQSLMSKWLDKSCYVYIINDVLAKAYELTFLLCICNVEKHMNQKGFLIEILKTTLLMSANSLNIWYPAIKPHINKKLVIKKTVKKLANI